MDMIGNIFTKSPIDLILSLLMDPWNYCHGRWCLFPPCIRMTIPEPIHNEYFGYSYTFIWIAMRHHMVRSKDEPSHKKLKLLGLADTACSNDAISPIPGRRRNIEVPETGVFGKISIKSQDRLSYLRNMARPSSRPSTVHQDCNPMETFSTVSRQQCWRRKENRCIFQSMSERPVRGACLGSPQEHVQPLADVSLGPWKSIEKRARQSIRVFFLVGKRGSFRPVKNSNGCEREQISLAQTSFGFCQPVPSDRASCKLAPEKSTAGQPLLLQP